MCEKRKPINPKNTILLKPDQYKAYIAHVKKILGTKTDYDEIVKIWRPS